MSDLADPRARLSQTGQHKPAKSGINKIYVELPVRRLSALSPLCDADKLAMRGLDPARQRFERGAVLPARADGRLLFIVSGWVSTSRILPDGREQFLHLGLPGDPVGDIGQPIYPSASRTVALTTVQTIDATALNALAVHGGFQYPDVALALRAAQHRTNGYIYDHLMRLGSRNALISVGHLLLEIFDRLSEVGMTHSDQFLVPISQKQFGELVSLSEVHINRVMRLMKTDGWTTVGPGWISLPRRAALAELVGYSCSSAAAAYELH